MNLIIVIIAILVIIDLVDCTQTELLYITRTFKSVPAAINYVHASLPENAPLDEKCKRYAILLSIVSGNTKPHESDAFRVSALDSYNLNKEYQAMHADDVAQSYMIAIERYRIRKLAPPFLELIECLRRIDAPKVRLYLNNPELSIIANLYKQVLSSPSTKINLDRLKLDKFHPFFRDSLKNHFSNYIDSVNDSSPSIHYTGGPSDGGDITSNSVTTTSLTDLQSPSDDTQYKVSSEQYKLRRRERKRLTEKRQRTLNPEAVRERDRRRQRMRRERLKLQSREETNDNDMQSGPENGDIVSSVTPESLPAVIPSPDDSQTVRDARRLRQELRRRELFPAKRQKYQERIQAEKRHQAENLELLKRYTYLQRMIEYHERQQVREQSEELTPDWLFQSLSPAHYGIESNEPQPIQSTLAETMTPLSQIIDPHKVFSPSLPNQTYNYVIDSALMNDHAGLSDYFITWPPPDQEFQGVLGSHDHLTGGNHHQNNTSTFMQSSTDEANAR